MAICVNFFLAARVLFFQCSPAPPLPSPKLPKKCSLGAGENKFIATYGEQTCEPRGPHALLHVQSPFREPSQAVTSIGNVP